MTPHSITSKILELCNAVCPGQKPVYIPVDPLPNQKVNDCFRIIPKHIDAHGGKQIIGWAIWESIEFMIIEAEFHAIWRSPTGEQVDISPKDAAVKRVLFLPDPSRKYEGPQVLDNIRHPMIDDPLLKEVCIIFHNIHIASNEPDVTYDAETGLAVSPKLLMMYYKMEQLRMAVRQRYGNH